MIAHQALNTLSPAAYQFMTTARQVVTERAQR
jgi:hypothetical protein